MVTKASSAPSSSSSSIVTTAVEEAGKEAGLSKDQVEQIKRDVLGVRPKAAQE